MYIALFLLLLPFIAAEEETIYSGTVKSGDTIEEKGYSFSIKVAANVGAYIKYNNRSTIVKQSQCELMETLTFCVGTTSYSHRNSTSWEDVYQIQLTVTEKKGILINRTFDKRKLLIDEKTNAYVKIINDGVTELQDVDYIDAYPPELEVGKVEWCFVNNNAIEWHGTIGPGAQQVCTYTLLGIASVENRSEASATYFDGKQKQRITSERAILRVQNHSLKVSPTITTTKPGINGTIEISLIIENLYSGELKVTSFDIRIPDAFVLLKNGNELSSKGQGLFWEGQLEREEKKNLSFTLQTKKVGNFTLDITEQYTVSTFERNLKDSFIVSVECECPEIQYKFSERDGKPFLTVNLLNPSYEIIYKNILVTSSLAITPNHEQIAPRENLLLFKGEVSEGNAYNVTIEYDTGDGQHFTDHKTIQATEEPTETVPEQEIMQETLPPKAPESNDSEIIPEKTQENESSTPKQADNTKNRALIVLAVALILSAGIFTLLKRRH